ncbi:hypothetical protein GCG54_00015311 [Colletotrichum gloeosporioides]|uniref:Uncharacterized protein n=1 Tax=Colletotrichum gloeosporioides TaxID=474922 RepID=A0A8H4FFH8_COLGL|nr:uncharacterized protein GCG54_00015311 [Colletotrichum gloeosporioides]KAF3799129.1 hypothetical protein GCG54_00015311 [Colletotrichum gloeosporioides]
MSCCNISPETVVVENLKDGDYEDKVAWDSQYVRVVLEDRAALFPYKESSLLKESLKQMVRHRGASKRSDPLDATSLKVCANSAYGAADESEEGSRRCVSEALSSLLKEFEDTPLQGQWRWRATTPEVYC